MRDRFIARLQHAVDRILIGPRADPPIPFRPRWDERRLDRLHDIDEPGPDPAALALLDRAFPHGDTRS